MTRQRQGFEVVLPNGEYVSLSRAAIVNPKAHSNITIPDECLCDSKRIVLGSSSLSAILDLAFFE